VSESPLGSPLSPLRQLGELGRLSLRGATRRPLRSGLTALGVAIGMAAVVALGSLSLGAQRAVTQQLERLGYDVVFVLPPGAGPGPGAASGPGPGGWGELSLDLRLLEEREGVARVGAWLRRTLPVAAGRAQGFLPVVGIYPDLSELEGPLGGGASLVEGRVPHEAADDEVLLSAGAARDLGVGVGDSVRVRGRELRVSGIVRWEDDPPPQGALFVPMERLWELTGKRDTLTFAWVKARPGYDVVRLERELQEVLREAGAAALVQSSQRIFEVVRTALRVLNATLTAIAAVALFVGGLGLMNTMYTAVVERTREIGVLSALGARPGQILLLFVLEAGWLGFLGGVAGVVLGYGFALSLSVVLRQWVEGAALAPGASAGLIALALLVAVGLGMLAGWLPARRAALLPPVEALRYE